jgi:hypothetical protein
VSWAVGIDLGTTHCAVAYTRIDSDDRILRTLPLDQPVAAGESAARELLPSFLFLPLDATSWDDAVVGAWARDQGAQTPNRLIQSSKSWICHGGVNRRAKILPWSAPDSVPKLSPFEASAKLLAHLRACWDARMDAPLHEQEVVVTVPASFGEDARALTLEAAARAGLGEVRLLEEPQAALYDFLGAQDDLAAALGDARLGLVVDVGGGTTDLTLLTLDPDEPENIERIAVGGHLVLGGDNMDATVAHRVAAELGLDGTLDPTEWAALVSASRSAKEALLAADPPEQFVVTVQRRGSRLIGGTKSFPVRREQLAEWLVDGFFPRTARDAVPESTGRAGLTQLGLPFETDPAIPRHVCAFLRRHARGAAEAGARIVDGLPRPDVVLLNGGVFAAPAIAERFDAVLEGWFDAPVRRLPHTSLDTAVARGAARYALAAHGVGVLIRGGTARATYIGVEDEGRRRALCIVERGAESATSPDRTLQLTLGRRVAFPVYSADDRDDQPGDLVDPDELVALPPLVSTLARPDGARDLSVPVTLEPALTDDGSLEMALVTVTLPPRRWKLAFDLSGESHREDDTSGEASEPEDLPKNFGTVVQLVKRAFDTRQGADPKVAKSLRKDLEGELGPRASWSGVVCRALADALLDHVDGRSRSVQHELAWLRVLGWGLRPGVGLPGDIGRIDRVWSLFEGGPAHPDDKAVWTEWWILWRRAAMGLQTDRQVALFETVAPWLDPNGRRPGNVRMGGQREMVRMVAVLERIPPADKRRTAQWMLQRQKKLGSWWALGRLGARRPGAGEPVAPSVASDWLRTLLDLDWSTADGASFAAALIAQRRDDALDVDTSLRSTVEKRLERENASPHWIAIVREVTELGQASDSQLYGEALPIGLSL